MRSYFFGEEGSTRWQRDRLVREYSSYIHYDVEIRDQSALETIFREYDSDLTVIIHTASQPSHDWSAQEPFMDFTLNANGTLNLLEYTRQYCPQAVFIFTSTNKADIGESSFRIVTVAPNYFFALLRTIWNAWRNRRRFAKKADVSKHAEGTMETD